MVWLEPGLVLLLLVFFGAGPVAAGKGCVCGQDECFAVKDGRPRPNAGRYQAP